MLVDRGGNEVRPDTVSISIGPRGHASAAVESAMSPAPPGDPSQFVYRYVASAAADGVAAPTVPTRSSGATRGAPPQEYEFLVHAVGTAAGAPFEKTTGGFFLAQSAEAQIDASRASIAHVGGDLQLTIGLEVDRPGTFFASAELWAGSAGDQPVAFARQRLDGLAQGDQQVTLLFGGRVIRDANLDGPYVVRNVRLLRVDSLPPHAGDPIDELMTTQAYRAAEFF